MQSDKKIIWISSFPKSGNTWIRLILSGIFFTEDGKFENFKLLNRVPSHDILDNFSFIKNISLEDFNKIFKKDEYDEDTILAYSKYWIESQKRINLVQGNFAIFKTHNARVKINNHYYTDSSTTAGFIYIYRDPRDIAVSYSNHINKNIDQTIDYILNGQIMEKQKTNNKMPEITLDWKNHYLSWKKFSTEVPSLFIKYEDMLLNLEKEIGKIIEFFSDNFNIEVTNTENIISNIIKSTKFEKLQAIENKKGFLEKSENAQFFRKGLRNQWKEKLNNQQIKRITKAFFKEMKELGYVE